jgi:hypothetical protein
VTSAGFFGSLATFLSRRALSDASRTSHRRKRGTVATTNHIAVRPNTARKSPSQPSLRWLFSSGFASARSHAAASSAQSGTCLARGQSCSARGENSRFGGFVQNPSCPSLRAARTVASAVTGS